MSLKFNWPDFNQQPHFVELTKRSLTDVLNEGEKPTSVAGPIIVTGLAFGSQPPEIEILSINEASLSQEAFGASIQIMYEGDAFIELETVVQANPVSVTGSRYSSRSMKRVGILCAHKELEVPLKLKISQIKFAGILAINKTKDSLDVRFKSDPLKSVQITSTFDSIASARKVVQRMVEGKLREFILVKLPIMASRLNDLLNHIRTNDSSSLTTNGLRHEDKILSSSPLAGVVGDFTKLGDQCA